MAKACLVQLIKQLLRRTLNKLLERKSPLEFQAGFFLLVTVSALQGLLQVRRIRRHVVKLPEVLACHGHHLRVSISRSLTTWQLTLLT